MSDEIKKAERRFLITSPNVEREGNVEEDVSNRLNDDENDLLSVVSTAMSIMKLSRKHQSKEESEKEFGSVKANSAADHERILLRDRLQEKLSELLDEQEALVELYVKAAKAAKEKEEEYKERIIELVEQTEKDRQLMDLFRNF